MPTTAQPHNKPTVAASGVFLNGPKEVKGPILKQNGGNGSMGYWNFCEFLVDRGPLQKFPSFLSNPAA